MGKKVAVLVSLVLCLSFTGLSCHCWHKGKETLNWPSENARVCKYEEHIHTDRYGRERKTYTTTLRLRIDGANYKRAFSGVLDGKPKVFFNPVNPGEFVLEQGVQEEQMGYPVFGAIFTGVLSLALVAVCLSPKE